VKSEEVIVTGDGVFIRVGSIVSTTRSLSEGTNVAAGTATSDVEFVAEVEPLATGQLVFE
jgi:uridine phosphorylase